jgi:hypothetical protein
LSLAISTGAGRHPGPSRPPARLRRRLAGQHLIAGSAIVYFDNGPARNGPAPLANTPRRQGKDSHYAPRTTAAARRQKSDFLLTGNVVDVCGGKPCHASGATSP